MDHHRTVLLFLPHLDVVGGLGVHCRLLLNALNTVRSPLRFVVVCPQDPGVLFPRVDHEPFETGSVDTERFTFQRVVVPPGFKLSGVMDSLLRPVVDQRKPDLVYCSYYTGMRSPGVPQVLTFHDAGFLDHPAVFGPVAEARRATFAELAPAVSCIHCISHDARDRICAHLAWDRSRTEVVWHALPETSAAIAMAKSTPPDQVTLAGATVPQLGPYVFVPVGAATGFNRVRKNVPTAVRAFRLVSTPELKMVIAGTAMLTDAVLAELLPETEKGRLHQGCWISDDSRIRIVPTLPRREFLAAMALARGVVYPSRYEGFGLPLLEAMALGVPLIASRATSVPEIVQDAAWLVPPDDVEGFTHAMQTLVANPGQTETLVATGLQRMADFTWERMGTAMTRLFLQQIEVPPVRTIG